MSKEFPKAYNPNETEDKWYSIWQKSDIYIANENSDKPSYSILMPPPNVTGILHFGHVLNQTIQDLYIRWKRMDGYEVCWFPGTDHAGIATQTRVEKELKKDNITRYDLGRDAFISKVWEWKEKYGGIILSQLRKLGLSCDWSRTLFTMDESASNAVRDVFIRLFDEGLIYKGKRIINWSPLSQTALSDEEVEFREVKEKIYTLRYLFPNSTEYLCVATARPETIFGDIAVAVNPNDERYNNLIGREVIVPLAGRLVKIIADDYADPTFGTGCVKITPAHDPNDFEVGMRHDLEMINTINPDGSLNELTGKYNGQDRFVARKNILKELEQNELIEKIEDYTHNVGFSQRGGEPVEPYLSDQWFVKMKPLAAIALNMVKDDKIKFYPNHWIKTYEHWMENIRDWCISRQLWWGHRIPVYYSPDGSLTAAINQEEARKKLNLSPDVELRQEEDVLDTWFSSWLWPLTTMKWHSDGLTEETPDLMKFLPTDLLVTAPDIIFFWVARMIMATGHLKSEIPFRNVYFTSTIRDGQGRKLSKSLGNSPDPLNIIEKYGADAVRFTMVYLSPLGQDIKMDIDVKAQDIPSMEIGRNFANKIWNAGRFLLMKREAFLINDVCPANENKILAKDDMTIANTWILSRFNSVVKKSHEILSEYRVNEFSKVLYDFIWRDFCDWYVEVLKVQTANSDRVVYNRSLIDFAFEIYVGILKILHPIMPFLTEEIWHLISDRQEHESISIEALPKSSVENINPEVESKFEYLQTIVEELRKLRALLQIPPSQKVDVVISLRSQRDLELLSDQKNVVISLAKCNRFDIGINLEKPEKAIASMVLESEIFMILDSSIDVEQEKKRIMKEIERFERNIKTSLSKLSNEKFVSNAPAEIVEYERQKVSSMQFTLEKIKANFDSLG